MLILAAWGGALLWLIERQYLSGSNARFAAAALGVSPGAQFFRLSLGAQQLGYASTTVDTLQDSIRLVDVLVLDVPALGRLGRTSGRSVTTLDRALRLLTVTSDIDGAAERFTANAAITPDNALRVTLVTMGDTVTTGIVPGDHIELPSLWPLRLSFAGRLRRGRGTAARVLDPFTLQLRDRDFHVAAESTFILADSADFDSTTMAWVPVHFDTVHAVLVDATGPGGPVKWWIDAQGHVVRASLPLGFTIERTAFEIAYENFRRRDTLRLMRATMAPGPGTVVPMTVLAAGLHPMPPRDTMALRVRLGGGDLTGLDVDGGRQRLQGDTLTVSLESDAQIRSRYRLPDSDTTHREALRPDILITSADRRIVRQAALVAGQERDPGKVAAALVHWVAGAVQSERSDAIPMATEALARRRGDSNDHVVLFVALARSLGLPARPVAGLLLLNGRYYYHAWAEVLLGDWVAVDPTFDQFPADVAHVRLVIGGFARPTELTPRVGRLTLDTL